MAREGFGLRLIRRSVVNELEGTIERQVEEDGFAVHLMFPLLPDRLLMPSKLAPSLELT
jgi:two-component sensor histidine kinase